MRKETLKIMVILNCETCCKLLLRNPFAFQSLSIPNVLRILMRETKLTNNSPWFI